MMASLESMLEPLGERDFDRILLRNLKLIESFGKRAVRLSFEPFLSLA